MTKTNPKVDGFLRKPRKWQEELRELRTIILDLPLTEDVKWRAPCYTFEGKNIVLINEFKEYCAVLFFKGALLKDAKKILVRPGEHTQAGRMMRFTSVQEITKKAPTLKAYIKEAIEVEKAGLQIEKVTPKDFVYPDELQDKLNKSPALKKAFAALTPGRQRAYLLYFSGAKQSKTRIARIEKCTKDILAGKGLND